MIHSIGESIDCVASTDSSKSTITYITLNTQANIIVAGYSTGEIKFYSSSLEQVSSLEDNYIVKSKSSITCLCLAKNNKLLAFATNKGVLKIYDILKDEYISEVNRDKTYIVDMTFNSNDSYLICGESNGDIALINLVTFSLNKMSNYSTFYVNL